MILKRIRKVEYNENGEAIIENTDKLFYDVHFIDNDDWLCIDEDDYTPSKKSARDEERRRQLMKQYADVDYSRLPKPNGKVFYTSYILPTIRAEFIKLEFTITDDGKVEFQ
jgi:hypothetical protein